MSISCLNKWEDNYISHFPLLHSPISPEIFNLKPSLPGSKPQQSNATLFQRSFLYQFYLDKNSPASHSWTKRIWKFFQNLGMETVICQRLDNQGIIPLTSSSNLTPKILLHICLMTNIKPLIWQNIYYFKLRMKLYTTLYTKFYAYKPHRGRIISFNLT